MSKQLSYLPKLDALRAIAALMVLFSHYLVEVNGPKFSYGGNGVQIFFVISGFLITTILLRQKMNVSVTKAKIISNFIIKRALRLFPVYYLLLIVLLIISVVGGLWISGKGDWLYYFTYTQNYLFLKKGFQTPLLNHTWSLAVEEQFYLFWPFILILLPKRAELPVLVSIFMVGVFSKIYFIDYFHCTGTVKGVTFIHFDTLGAGALLAYSAFYKKEMILNFLERFADLFFMIGFIASGIMTYEKFNDSFFLPFSLTLMGTSLVFICSLKKKSILDPILNLNILQKIGKISYGVYLFHKPVPFFVNYILGKFGMTLVLHPVFQFLIYAVIALTIAMLSWIFFEKRVLKLKEKFDL